MSNPSYTRFKGSVILNSALPQRGSRSFVRPIFAPIGIMLISLSYIRTPYSKRNENPIQTYLPLITTYPHHPPPPSPAPNPQSKPHHPVLFRLNQFPILLLLRLPSPPALPLSPPSSPPPTPPSCPSPPFPSFLFLLIPIRNGGCLSMRSLIVSAP